MNGFNHEQDEMIQAIEAATRINIEKHAHYTEAEQMEAKDWESAFERNRQTYFSDGCIASAFRQNPGFFDGSLLTVVEWMGIQTEQSGEVLVKREVFDVCNDITGRSTARAYPGIYVCDKVMTAYASILNHMVKEKFGENQQSIILLDFGISELIAREMTEFTDCRPPTKFKTNHDEVTCLEVRYGTRKKSEIKMPIPGFLQCKLTLKQALDKYMYVGMPVNIGKCHWALLLIRRDDASEKVVIHYADSWGRKPAEEIQAIQRYIVKKLDRKCEITRLPCPHQANGVDCGFAVLRNAELMVDFLYGKRNQGSPVQLPRKIEDMLYGDGFYNGYRITVLFRLNQWKKRRRDKNIFAATAAASIQTDDGPVTRARPQDKGKAEQQVLRSAEQKMKMKTDLYEEQLSNFSPLLERSLDIPLANGSMSADASPNNMHMASPNGPSSPTTNDDDHLNDDKSQGLPTTNDEDHLNDLCPIDLADLNRKKPRPVYNIQEKSKGGKSSTCMGLKAGDEMIIPSPKKNPYVVKLEGQLATMIGKLQRMIGEQQATIGKLQTTIGEQQATIGKLQTSIGEQQATIGKLQTSIDEQQATIGNLQKRLQGLETSRPAANKRKLTERPLPSQNPKKYRQDQSQSKSRNKEDKGVNNRAEFGVMCPVCREEVAIPKQMNLCNPVCFSTKKILSEDDPKRKKAFRQRVDRHVQTHHCTKPLASVVSSEAKKGLSADDSFLLWCLQKGADDAAMLIKLCVWENVKNGNIQHNDCVLVVRHASIRALYWHRRVREWSKNLKDVTSEVASVAQSYTVEWLKKMNAHFHSSSFEESLEQHWESQEPAHWFNEAFNFFRHPMHFKKCPKWFFNYEMAE